jgi:ABC-2 type transport system ATP-binding protein
VIISRGQTMYYGQLDQLRKAQQSRVVVRPADPQQLITALQEARHTAIEHLPEGRIAVSGVAPEQVGDIALQAQVAIYGMHTEHADLERIFFQLTSGQFSGARLSPHQQQQQPPPGWQPPQQPGGGY